MNVFKKSSGVPTLPTKKADRAFDPEKSKAKQLLFKEGYRDSELKLKDGNNFIKIIQVYNTRATKFKSEKFSSLAIGKSDFNDCLLSSLHRKAKTLGFTKSAGGDMPTIWPLDYFIFDVLSYNADTKTAERKVIIRSANEKSLGYAIEQAITEKESDPTLPEAERGGYKYENILDLKTGNLVQINKKGSGMGTNYNVSVVNPLDLSEYQNEVNNLPISDIMYESTPTDLIIEAVNFYIDKKYLTELF